MRLSLEIGNKLCWLNCRLGCQGRAAESFIRLAARWRPQLKLAARGPREGFHKMTSCQWPNPRTLTQVLRCDYPPPLFPRGATMRSFSWIGLSFCIFTVCTKSALTHRPNLSSARDLAAALRSELVGGPFQGICSSTTAFGSNAMANCDSTVLPHNETAGMKQDSYSGTFMKWAEPLLRMVPEPPRSSK